MRTVHPARGHVLVIIAAICFGINGGIARVPMEAGLSAGSFTAIRLGGAFVLFLLIALAFDRSALKPPRGRELWLMIALGLFGVAAVQWTYNVAISRLPLGLAVLLEYLAPVYVVLWVRFVYGTPVHRRVWPGIALAILGLALIGQIWGPSVGLDPIGLFAASLSGFAFAAYFLLGERLTTHQSTGHSPLHVVVWSFGIGAIAVVLLQWPIEGIGSLNTEASMMGIFETVTVTAWVPLALSITIGTVVPFFLYLLAMRYIPSSQASVTAMLEPLIAVAVGWLWFYEALSAVQALGVLVVVLGIVMAQSARTDDPVDLPLTT